MDFFADFSMLLLGVISALLILVVLLQRGRGGGLAGAFGGLGGQSAFGTKAGDVFTKITIGLVTAWVLLAGVSGVLARKASEKYVDDKSADVSTTEDSESSAGSMSAVGDASSESSDDATDESADDDSEASDSSASETDNADKTDAGAATSSEEGADADSKAESTDEKVDAEPAPAESETATTDDKKVTDE